MTMFREKRVLQLLNLLTPFIAGAITLVLGGGGSWEDVFVDQSVTKLLSPAPITFAIWGPIFFLLGLFYFYQARDLFPGQEEVEMIFLRQVNVFFLLSTVMATVWFVIWAQRMIWGSVFAMIFYLLTILAAYFRLGINLQKRPPGERLFVTSGWSMYAGWVFVATLVNTTTGLAYTGFENLPFTELQWTVAGTIVAVLIYLLFLFLRRDYIFVSVGIWALIGVGLTHLNPVPPSNFSVLLISFIGAVILMISTILHYIITPHQDTPKWI
ncbi:MAG: hypothetical protein ACOC6H_03435 [Thermoproteota archaeon]